MEAKLSLVCDNGSLTARKIGGNSPGKDTLHCCRREQTPSLATAYTPQITPNMSYPGEERRWRDEQQRAEYGREERRWRGEPRRRSRSRDEPRRDELRRRNERWQGELNGRTMTGGMTSVGCVAAQLAECHCD